MADIRKYRRYRIYRQSGVALISALLIVAMVVSVTAFLAFETQLWIRQAENISGRAMSESVRRGAMEGALVMLLEDKKNNLTDHMDEEWFGEPLAGEVEGGVFIAHIYDAQARFNLNNLVKSDGTVNPDYVAIFQRLLVAVDLDETLADAVVDWLDNGSSQRPNGAEDLEYLDKKIPYSTANQLFSSVQELRLVKGFDGETVDRLTEFLSALPQPTPININTAPPTIIQILFVRQIPDAIITKLKETRPFDNKTDLMTLLKGYPAPNQATYDVKTDYFNVNVQTQFGQLTRRSQALIYRKNKNDARIVWQNQQVIILTPEDDESGNNT